MPAEVEERQPTLSQLIAKHVFNPQPGDLEAIEEAKRRYRSLSPSPFWNALHGLKGNADNDE